MPTTGSKARNFLKFNSIRSILGRTTQLRQEERLQGQYQPTTLTHIEHSRSLVSLRSHFGLISKEI